MAKTNEVVKYQTDSGEILLSSEIVRTTLAVGNNITDKEITMFLQLCKHQKLNPFLRECYIIKFGDRISMPVGKDTFTKRAAKNPRFEGFKAGTITMSGKEIVYRQGSFVINGETLLGGWAEVYVKGYAVPIRDEVSLAEYNTGKSQWKSMPATMIRKVALVHALREAFPEDFQGLYDESELRIDKDNSTAKHTHQHQQTTQVEPVTPETISYASKADLGELFELSGKNKELLQTIIKQFGFNESRLITKDKLGEIKEAVKSEIEASNKPTITENTNENSTELLDAHVIDSVDEIPEETKEVLEQEAV